MEVLELRDIHNLHHKAQQDEKVTCKLIDGGQNKQHISQVTYIFMAVPVTRTWAVNHSPLDHNQGMESGITRLVKGKDQSQELGGRNSHGSEAERKSKSKSKAQS